MKPIMTAISLGLVAADLACAAILLLCRGLPIEAGAIALCALLPAAWLIWWRR